MKSKNIILQQRRATILDYIREKEEASVNELAELLEVSVITIRRDLDQLAKENKILRIHGGARTIEILQNGIDGIDQKKIAIAKFAASLVETDDTVFINTSSTALLVAKYIDTRATIISNNSRIIDCQNERLKILLTGGNLNHPKLALTGEFALNNLNKVKSKICILGISGISFDTGLTTSNINEVAINKKMLAQTSEKKIIVADSSKINKAHNFTTGDINSFDILITDKDADDKFIAQLKSLGKTVYMVDY